MPDNLEIIVVFECFCAYGLLSSVCLSSTLLIISLFEAIRLQEIADLHRGRYLRTLSMLYLTRVHMQILDHWLLIKLLLTLLFSTAVPLCALHFLHIIFSRIILDWCVYS